MDALAVHLSNEIHGMATLGSVSNTSELVASLTAGNSLELQRATTEGLSFLAHLKRYAQKGGNDDRGDSE